MRHTLSNDVIVWIISSFVTFAKSGDTSVIVTFDVRSWDNAFHCRNYYVEIGSFGRTTYADNAVHSCILLISFTSCSRGILFTSTD